MSEKNLLEAEWKKFAKGRNLKDAAIIKALAALAAGKTPEAQLAALDDIDKQAEIIRKASSKDKEVTAYLDGIDKSTGKERKQVEADAKKAEADAKKAEADAKKAAAAKKDEGGDEDEESPALLTTKMVPLLREVKKGELILQAMIALAGKETVVLISRKPISAARGKLLKEQMSNPSGIKFIRGECRWEANALTFVVQAAAGGLAKKVKAAVLAQTELRMNVRVRGEDPDDVDDDGDAPEPGDMAAGAAATAAPPTEAKRPVDEAMRARYESRLAELEPQIQAALQAQHPESGKLRAVADFAREKGDGELFEPALAALEQIAKLLATPLPQGSSPAPTAEAGTTATDPGTAFKARLTALLPHIKTAMAAGGEAATAIKDGVAEAGDLARKKDFEAAQARLDAVEQLLGDAAKTAPTGGGKPAPSQVEMQKARLVWDGLAKTVQSQFASIENAVMAAVRTHNEDPEVEDEFDEAAIGSKLQELFQTLDQLDKALLDKLDEALNADGPQRDARYAEASVMVKQFRTFAASDPMLAFIDNNGFASTDIRAKVDNALAELGDQF